MSLLAIQKTLALISIMNLNDNKVTSFFLDPNIKLTSKFAYAVIIVFLAFIINDLTSFTYNYNLSNKIETIENLNELKETTNDSTIIKFAEYKINQVVCRKGVIETIYQSVSKNLLIKYNKNTTDDINNKSNINIYFWFLFSSGGIYYFFSLLIFIVILFNNTLKESFSHRLGQSIFIK